MFLCSTFSIEATYFSQAFFKTAENDKSIIHTLLYVVF